MHRLRILVATAICLTAGAYASESETVVRAAMDGKAGAFVLIDRASGEITASNAEAAAKRLPPCSTFKIWNALLGIEAGILTASDQPFYEWDGVERPIAAWNRDLNLRDAFQTSCVPAFQALARQLGAERMHRWIAALGYGDRDTSAGIDVFWLPAPGRRAILISPMEQAELLGKLTTGRLPVKETSVSLLKDLMRVKSTAKGTLYGKTGSGTFENTGIGWFVGFVERGAESHVFAAQLSGPHATGAAARTLAEAILTELQLL